MTRRALAVWVLVIVAETIHGIARTLLLAPRVGDFRARPGGLLSIGMLVLALAPLIAVRLRGGLCRFRLGFRVVREARPR